MFSRVRKKVFNTELRGKDLKLIYNRVIVLTGKNIFTTKTVFLFAVKKKRLYFAGIE